jgi:hypothetical protein
MLGIYAPQKTTWPMPLVWLFKIYIGSPLLTDDTLLQQIDTTLSWSFVSDHTSRIEHGDARLLYPFRAKCQLHSWSKSCCFHSWMNICVLTVVKVVHHRWECVRLPTITSRQYYICRTLFACSNYPCVSRHTMEILDLHVVFDSLLPSWSDWLYWTHYLVE